MPKKIDCPNFSTAYDNFGCLATVLIILCLIGLYIYSASNPTITPVKIKNIDQIMMSAYYYSYLVQTGENEFQWRSATRPSKHPETIIRDVSPEEMMWIEYTHVVSSIGSSNRDMTIHLRKNDSISPGMTGGKRPQQMHNLK